MLRDLFDQKPYLKRLILIILLIIVGIIIISFVVPLFIGENLTYEKLEQKIKSAAVTYYEENENQLPENGNSTILSYETLEENKLLKPIEKYLKKGVTCNAQVTVKNVNGTYSYTPYLDCGKDYTTKEFYKKILEDNEVVTIKDGLYIIGDKHVFRGELINNYVSFADNIWRIVKIDNDNTVELVSENSLDSVTWDDRYNSEKGYNYGKNDYNVSRIKNALNDLYDSEEFISEDDKSLLASKQYCLDARGNTENLKTNLTCNKLSENAFIGLLTVDEYINASIDDKCSNTTNYECQNYNYLSSNERLTSFYTITPTNANTYQVYYVRNSGEINVTNCSSIMSLRPVIYLSSSAIYNGGNGSVDEPYTIK